MLDNKKAASLQRVLIRASASLQKACAGSTGDRPVPSGDSPGYCLAVAVVARMCLARIPGVGQERGIYPAGTPALQIGAWKFQGPFACQPSCGLKSAPRSLA